MENEEWRDIPGYEGLYQINIDTPEGKCRSLNYHRTGKVREFSKKPRKYDGRLYWDLSKDGKPTTYQAARWIALTYPELVTNEYFEGAEIDHIDTDPSNNHPSNLRWVSHKENQNNPLTRAHNSEAQKGNQNHNKWVIKLNKNNEILHFYPSAVQAEKETGVNRARISECCLGKIKSAGGYIWKHAE